MNIMEEIFHIRTCMATAYRLLCDVKQSIAIYHKTTHLNTADQKRYNICTT